MRWEKKVYHLPTKQKLNTNSRHWLQLRKRVFKRDKYQCQRCKNFFMERGLLLQAHHIIPRKAGGKTVLDNLISLCPTCHDYVELNPGSLDDIFPVENKKNEPTKKLDWHKWVYGGYKKPST